LYKKAHAGFAGVNIYHITTVDIKTKNSELGAIGRINKRSTSMHNENIYK
jgi:hypothetical protein